MLLADVVSLFFSFLIHFYAFASKLSGSADAGAGVASGASACGVPFDGGDGVVVAGVYRSAFGTGGRRK